MFSYVDNTLVRAFGLGYFHYSASVLDLRHIGMRPNASVFWSRLQRTGVKSGIENPQICYPGILILEGLEP